jgi:ubiquitin-protein ligase
MTSPRVRRLEQEFDEMVRLRQTSSLIDFDAHGTPPTRYTVEYRCRGLCRQDDNAVEVEHHSCDVLLGDRFPYQAPLVIWSTPIFHPNFMPPLVCLGNHWYPAWSIAEMCVALCEMVQYKVFNIYDPLDPVAAKWLERMLQETPEQFPVDPRPIRDLDFDVIRAPHERGARHG